MLEMFSKNSLQCFYSLSSVQLAIHLRSYEYVEQIARNNQKFQEDIVLINTKMRQFEKCFRTSGTTFIIFSFIFSTLITFFLFFILIVQSST